MKIKNVFGALLFLASAFHALGQTAPQVTVTMPTNGATYFAPANIYLRAEASDTNGIAFTQIRVGANSMGSSKTNSVTTAWTNVSVGTYIITGEAMNNAYIRGTSAPVTISVIINPSPFVSITAADSHATEGGDDLGAFKISRTGDVTSDLTVFYSITGTASNGVDIVTLPASVVIPTGSSNATLIVQPIDDTLLETTESVILTLKTNSAYRLDSPTSTTVYVYDNEANHPPTVQVVDPHNGDNFSDPVTISLTAEASDLDGPVATVSFFRNGILIAYGTKNPTNNTFITIWTNVPAGNMAITALARDGINTSLSTTSGPVNITVTRTNPNPYVIVTAPANGKVYTNVGTLSLSAYTSTGDAARYIKKVEFFVDTTLFGTFTNATTPNYSMQWTNPSLGTHVFTTRATDDGGTGTDSLPVTFGVVSNQIVTVTATDATASEPGTDNGVFKISRTGNVSDSLVVNYRLTGTASNGVDYSFLPGSATLTPGSSNAFVIVQPLDDTLIESTETVTLTLLTSNNAAGVVLGSAITATVSIYDNDTNHAPTVVIFNPTNNSTITLPTNILLQAEAHDDVAISGVAFYRGTNWIGTTYASSNGTASVFNFLWTNPPTGDFSITARAYDNLQKAATSAPVHVVITGPISNTMPTVSLYYPTNGSKFTSPTNIELTALASESNGVIATVQFFANGGSLGVVSNNLASAQPGNIFHLTWTGPLPGSYTLTAKATDTNGAATTSAPVSVTVLSNTPPNIPPTVYIDSPTNHSVFYGPTNITITAQAFDTDGQVARVYFFNGSQLLGSSTNAPYSVIWSNVPVGTYSITAKAIDNREGSGYSTPVSITVRSLTEYSFVSRSLPLWYVPGVKMTVKLQASPKTNTTSYFVQDTPPAGWTINSVGENGSIITGGLGVTFGPFNDKLARTFSYTATPPANESGEKHFIGTGTANGFTSPIVGVTAINAAQPHPADLNPTNYFIGTNELDAYTLAWKRCENWPVSPSPVPVNYLTRAGYIARGGGSYAISTNFPSPQPPLIWVHDSTAPDSTTNTLAGSVPWTTNNYGSAIATMPTNYFSNVSFTVSISVTPATACSAYAVEDRPPEGWVVSNVTGGGFFCPILKKVKWGLFLDNQARTLTYQITPTTNLSTTVAFSGVASFDGINVPITGRRYTYFSAGTVPPAKLQSIITSPNGDRIITFNGQPGVVYQLEGSENLTDWSRMDQLLNNDGVLYYTDPATTNFPNRFYRALPEDGN